MAFIKVDSIPQGNLNYKIYFAEFGSSLINAPCDIEIKGNRMLVSQDESTNVTRIKISFDGII